MTDNELHDVGVGAAIFRTTITAVLFLAHPKQK